MADLFDALADRALGTAATLVPTPVPRYAAPVHAQLHEGPALVSPDGPTPLGKAGPRRPPEPARTRAGDPAPSLPPDPDEPREVARPVGGRDPGPNPEAFELESGAEKPGATPRVHLADGSDPEPAPVDADSPSAHRAPHRGHRNGEASSLGLPAAEPRTGRLRAAVAREWSGDTETRRPRPPYELDDRSAQEPQAPEAPPPQVTVSIGYVEVRAPAKAPETRTATRAPRPEPRLSLQDYLRRDGRR